MEKIKTIITRVFGTDSVLSEDHSSLQPSLTIKTELIADVCLLLRDHPETYFDFLSCLSAIDYGIEKNMLGIVYHLASIPYKNIFVLKISMPFDRAGDLPEVPTVSNVWRTADWHEREAYDLMGIRFTAHPDLRRILCVEGWEGHPLRKDYRTAEEFNGIKIDF
jgi:NADH-quinone oxidoreductase subunit C